MATGWSVCPQLTGCSRLKNVGEGVGAAMGRRDGVVRQLVLGIQTEKSTDQVIKPVNIEALSKWVGEIPDDVVSDMHNIAPMLLTLGYDPYANPPNYGKPDPEVADNTLHIRTNREFWKQKEKDIFDHLDVDENPKQRPSKNGVVELGIREGQGQGHENDANRYANESGRSR
ncbi:hypothetical protein C0Q70_08375 [Pomacea canaliculata]|uniref:Protein-tyrosine sulfotransferase n=1 Tax=Pomacea canaliculata TaxID=400727 RepID=A0A2T7PHN1_POMCA|nr:hypothetical protein C0Q70_08375 [Pomacea canaliculata]